MTHARPMSGLLRTIVVTLLVVALPLASLASVSASVSCACEAAAEAPAGHPDGCCPTAAGGGDFPGPDCGAGDDGDCQCPSCQDFLSIVDQGALRPLRLAGAHSPDDVRMPPTGIPSAVFRPPLA